MRNVAAVPRCLQTARRTVQNTINNYNKVDNQDASTYCLVLPVVIGGARGGSGDAELLESPPLPGSGDNSSWNTHNISYYSISLVVY